MAKHLHIFGLVQGVGFRYHFAQQAHALGLRGWVRNRSQGSVEAEIEGADDAVEALIAWAHVGPAAASVERVEVSEAAGGYSVFELRATL